MENRDMSNVQKVSGAGYFRVPMHGAPPLRGWNLQYVSGLDDPDVKPGYWLSQWNVSPISDTTANLKFCFEPELIMCFDTEAEAMANSDTLRKEKIETEVVKVG